jgi:hypothetical protein
MAKMSFYSRQSVQRPAAATRIRYRALILLL